MFLLISGVALAAGSYLWNKSEEKYQREIAQKYMSDRKNFEKYVKELDRSLKYQLRINIVIGLVWIAYLLAVVLT